MKSHSPHYNQAKGKVGDYVVSHRGNDSIVSQRVFNKPESSDAQKEQQVQLSGSSQGWKLLTPAGRASYADLGSRMRGKSGKPMKGHNCYSSITNTRALMGLDPLPMAPALPLQSPTLPSPLFLSSVNDGIFRLQIHSAAYSGPILLECAPWVSAGVSYFSKSSFRVCGVEDNLAAGQTSIGPEFLSRFTTPPAGSQIVVRLTPMTETGFRGATTTYSAFVAATEEEMLADLEERKVKAAKKGKLQLVAA